MPMSQCTKGEATDTAEPEFEGMNKLMETLMIQVYVRRVCETRDHVGANFSQTCQTCHETESGQGGENTDR